MVCHVIFPLFARDIQGSAVIVLFLDMRNVGSSRFLTVCTVLVSMQVFATKRTRKRTRMEGHNLYVTSVCNCWDVLIFAKLFL